MATRKTTATTTKKKASTRAPRARRGSGGNRPRVVVDDVVADGFFARLENDHPFVKAVILGNAGTGKSTLAARLAVGLHRRIGSTRPIAIVETEHAAHHLTPVLDAAGIPAVRRVTRSLVDWVEAVTRAVAGGADIVITDSLTHFWEDLQAAYVATTGRTELAAADWVALKAVWHREWSALFRSAPVHIICCARAAPEYVDVVGDDGRVTSVRAGLKVRGEAEVAFEPSLLLEMARIDGDTADGAGVVVRTCKVLKDRKDKVDGRTFIDATYADFAAVVDATLAGAVAAHAVEERPSTSYFDGAGGASRQARALVGEVKGELDRWWPSSAAADKQARAQALHHAFGHGSWARLQTAGVEQLDGGLQRLRALGGQAPSPTSPSPEQVLATIRRGLISDPGDPTQRHAAIAAAQTLASTLVGPERASALGTIERVRRAWEQADVDQRTPWDGDDLPY